VNSFSEARELFFPPITGVLVIGGKVESRVSGTARASGGAETWQAGDNVTIDEVRVATGGLVSWASFALVQQGVPVTQWGSTGVDVPVGYVPGAHDRMSREGSAHCIRVCVEPGGQRTFLSTADEEFPPLPVLPDGFLADAVVIDGYALLAGRNASCLREVLPQVVSEGAPVVVALPVPRKLASSGSTDFLDTLRDLNVNVVVGGVEEQELLPGEQPWYRVTTTGVTRPWVSLDFPDSSGRLKVLAPLLDRPLSTTGAGDVFAGALAAALVRRNWLWPAAIREAHDIASEHVASRSR
jgi:hypothetical protein